MKRDLIFSLLTGFFLSLAFPPFHLGFLAYVALIPFFFLLQSKNFRESARWGYATGLFVNLGTLYWISWVTVPGAIAAILYLPVYFVLYAVIHTFLQRRLPEKYFYLCIPFLWTGMEYLRSLGVLGFPWNSLAYTQTYYLSLIQYAEYTSLFGVSFWIVWLNVIIFLIIKNVNNYRKIVFYFALLILLFLLPYIYGKIVVPPSNEAPQEKIRVGLVQGDIDPLEKWDDAFRMENLKIYQSLTYQMNTDSLDLIIWPETATPVYLRDSEVYRQAIREIVDSLHVSLITGTPDYQFLPDHSYKTFNAVFSFVPGKKNFDVYRKLHLVPFGERVPFTETFPFIADLLEKLEMGEGNFSPGDSIVSFKIPWKKTSASRTASERRYFMAPVVVCFESLFSNLVRKFVLNGADILIIITNDAWFGKSQAPFHHAQAAVFRAIENRISIARCANTGVSMFIDAYGRTSSETPIWVRTAISGELTPRQKNTFFSVHGHLFTNIVSLFNLLPLIYAILSLLRKNNS
ncbi:MAG: apolipoprotein N-acyltransferase [Calditrichaeota bacterium]|nr:apolipoprotein N-acyltransferase [Calditrichota bacterium]